jgi:hypothetical protein
VHRITDELATYVIPVEKGTHKVVMIQKSVEVRDPSGFGLYFVNSVFVSASRPWRTVRDPRYIQGVEVVHPAVGNKASILSSSVYTCVVQVKKPISILDTFDFAKTRRDTGSILRKCVYLCVCDVQS